MGTIQLIQLQNQTAENFGKEFLNVQSRVFRPEIKQNWESVIIARIIGVKYPKILIRLLFKSGTLVPSNFYLHDKIIKG